MDLLAVSSRWTGTSSSVTHMRHLRWHVDCVGESSGEIVSRRGVLRGYDRKLLNLAQAHNRITRKMHPKNKPSNDLGAAEYDKIGKQLNACLGGRDRVGCKYRPRRSWY